MKVSFPLKISTFSTLPLRHLPSSLQRGEVTGVMLPVMASISLLLAPTYVASCGGDDDDATEATPTATPDPTITPTATPEASPTPSPFLGSPYRAPQTLSEWMAHLESTRFTTAVMEAQCLAFYGEYPCNIRYLTDEEKEVATPHVGALFTMYSPHLGETDETTLTDEFLTYHIWLEEGAGYGWFSPYGVYSHPNRRGTILHEYQHALDDSYYGFLLVHDGEMLTHAFSGTLFTYYYQAYGFFPDDMALTEESVYNEIHQVLESIDALVPDTTEEDLAKYQYFKSLGYSTENALKLFVTDQMGIAQANAFPALSITDVFARLILQYDVPFGAASEISRRAIPLLYAYQGDYTETRGMQIYTTEEVSYLSYSGYYLDYNQIVTYVLDGEPLYLNPDFAQLITTTTQSVYYTYLSEHRAEYETTHWNWVYCGGTDRMACVSMNRFRDNLNSPWEIFTSAEKDAVINQIVTEVTVQWGI